MLDIRSQWNKVPPIIRRVSVPIIIGLASILIAVVSNHVSYSNSLFWIIVFLTGIIVAHVLWFHRVIQTFRHDLKFSIRPSQISSSATRFVAQDGEHLQNAMIEATFFQVLRDRLSVEHAPHIQAQCIQDDKMHLIQTSGLIPLLTENHLEILVQPIVSLPQKRVTFFSCIPCVTLENGLIISLNTVSMTSSYALSQQAIEQMVLFQTLQFIHNHQRSHPNHGFICSLLPNIYKDLKCLEEINEFLLKSHFPFHSLILEVPLDISDSDLKNLDQLVQNGVRLMGTWPNKDLPENLTELSIPLTNFVMFSYGHLSTWLKNQPRRQSYLAIQQILELPPQIIISHVNKEQEFYHQLPLPFDFAAGNAYGVAKPFYQIQV